MPNIRTGKIIKCCVCGEERYRTLSYLARGHTRMTCKSFACKAAAHAGENNSFWGKIHDEETRVRIREGRRANPPKGTGPKKGIFKHTPEAREKIRAASKLLWAENRDKMLASLAHLTKEFRREGARYRKNFSPGQRREWKDTQCAWCKTTGKLVLDHIIPVLCGGGNSRRNAQTLCQPCNLWKMAHIDLALFKAGLGERQGCSTEVAKDNLEES